MAEEPGDEVIRCDGDLVTAGLVNTHHHLYQWMTRGRCVGCDLFGWLVELYPVWGRLDVADVRAAALVGLAELALTGCTTAADHHYLVPRGDDTVFDAIVDAARTVGIRLHLARGSMDLGESRGGLPPDHVVEDIDAILASTESVIARHHDGERVVVTVAPCSPFSVTPELMRESAALARRHGLRLHTHLAETVDEERDVLERFGRRPVDLLDDLGWIDGDVWVAHGIHFDDAEVARLGAAGTGVAHCPSSNARLGAGMCRVVDLEAAGRPWGSAWTGRRPTRSAACSPSSGRRSTRLDSVPAARTCSCLRMRSAWRPRAALGASGGTTSACSNPATGPTWSSGPATISATSPTRSRDWSSVPIGEPGTSWSRGSPSSATVCSSGRTKARSAETWPNAPVGCGPERVDMPLQNRVTPLGELVAEPGRGLVYGNRGCLHDERGRIRRRFGGKRWIACRLRFRGWHREPLLQPGRFTELFFLDEATAFAAGHRPCALCRREDYVRFGEIWRELHPDQVGADAIDAQLHSERIDADSRTHRLYEATFDELPGRRVRPARRCAVRRSGRRSSAVDDRGVRRAHTATHSGPNDAHHTPVALGSVALRLASGRPAAPSIGGAGRRDGITAASGGAG